MEICNSSTYQSNRKLDLIRTENLAKVDLTIKTANLTSLEKLHLKRHPTPNGTHTHTHTQREPVKNLQRRYVVCCK